MIGSPADLSFENPVFCAYAFYAGILTLKVLFVTFWTSKNRIAHNALPLPEDYRAKGIVLKGKPVPVNSEVERVRRAHLNDIENIPLFLIVGLIYVLSDPALHMALWVFRVFTAGRFIHTISYLFLRITSTRGLGFIMAVVMLMFVSINVVCTGFSKGYY